MSRSVLLQAGHSAAFPPFLLLGGGAPGEATWTGSLAQAMRPLLVKAGVQVTVVGSWLQQINGKNVERQAPAVVTSQDYDLFVALHYDAAASPADTGCVAGRADDDPVGVSSDAFVAHWKRLYPAGSGIPWKPAMMTANITDYYAFRSTTDKTPGGLLEHGKGMGADHDFLFNHLDEVARLDVAAILAFLGVSSLPVGDPMLTNDELLQVQALAWGEYPFNPDFAIPKAWRAAEQGTALAVPLYLGKATSGELVLPDGAVQFFQLGRIVYRASDGSTIVSGGV